MGNKNKVIEVDFGGKRCEIRPFLAQESPVLTSYYVKMDIPSTHKGNISAFCQQIPTLMTAKAASNAYIVRWHDGIMHTMNKYTEFGGLQPVVRDEKGHVTQWAELYPATSAAVFAYGFAALSIVTSQYYLTEINHKLTMMSKGIDKILEFLYGDKKADLLSEISFANYARCNFASIMEHEDQRVATIQSLQEGRKTAIKDIEFYLADLYSTVYGKDDSDIEVMVKRAFQIRESLELSIQLYVMTNVLEVYYAQNFDPAYLSYVETDVSTYISKCEKQILGYFAALRAAVDVAKPKLGPKIVKKIDKAPLIESIEQTIELLGTGNEPELKKNLHQALYSVNKISEFYVTSGGEIYLKKA